MDYRFYKLWMLVFWYTFLCVGCLTLPCISGTRCFSQNHFNRCAVSLARCYTSGICVVLVLSLGTARQIKSTLNIKALSWRYNSNDDDATQRFANKPTEIMRIIWCIRRTHVNRTTRSTSFGRKSARCFDTSNAIKPEHVDKNETQPHTHTNTHTRVWGKSEWMKKERSTDKSGDSIERYVVKIFPIFVASTFAAEQWNHLNIACTYDILSNKLQWISYNSYCHRIWWNRRFYLYQIPRYRKYLQTKKER